MPSPLPHPIPDSPVKIKSPTPAITIAPPVPLDTVSTTAERTMQISISQIIAPAFPPPPPQEADETPVADSRSRLDEEVRALRAPWLTAFHRFRGRIVELARAVWEGPYSVATRDRLRSAWFRCVSGVARLGNRLGALIRHANARGITSSHWQRVIARVAPRTRATLALKPDLRVRRATISDYHALRQVRTLLADLDAAGHFDEATAATQIVHDGRLLAVAEDDNGVVGLAFLPAPAAPSPLSQEF